MGGKQGKSSKHKGQELDSVQMKDDYVKFIKREQIRRENEFKQRVHDKEIIYNQVKQIFKKDEQSFQNEEGKHSYGRSQTPRVETAPKKGSKIFKQDVADKIKNAGSKTHRKSRNIEGRTGTETDTSMSGANISANLINNTYNNSRGISISNNKQNPFCKLVHTTLSFGEKSKSENPNMGFIRRDSDDMLPTMIPIKTIHPHSFKIERVSDDIIPTQKFQDLYQKKDMEWVLMLSNELKQREPQEYAMHLLSIIESWLERGKPKLDPKEFRSLYIKKNPQDINSGKNIRGGSSMMSNSKKLTVLNIGQQMTQMMFEEKEESMMTNDIIGLSFYQVSEAYRKKFLTLYSHFQFEHFPIRKILNEYRQWLEDFIKEKQNSIKQAARMFQKENTAEYMKEQIQRLLEVLILQIKDFVGIISRATVLFYQLDVQAGEITEVCLYNLLTSLTLKNPIYSKLYELFKTAHRDQLEQIEIQIERVQAQRWDLGRVLGIDDIEIGRKMIIKKNKQSVIEEADQAQEDGSSQFSEYNQVENQKAKEVFERTLQKLFAVRSISSPSAKIEYFSKIFAEVMPDEGQYAADYVLNFLIYSLVRLGKKSSLLFVESVYIKSFAHEEIQDKIDEYQNISQIDSALQALIEGIDQHVNNLQQGIGSRSGSLASYQFDYFSNSSDRKKSDKSSEDSISNESKKFKLQNTLSKSSQSRQRKSTFQNTSINEKSFITDNGSIKDQAINNNLNGKYIRAASSQNLILELSPQKIGIQQVQRSEIQPEVSQDNSMKNKSDEMLVASPGNLPKANLVEDDQEELNLDRHHLANLRKERVSQWITHLNFDDVNKEPQDLQSVAQGAVGEDQNIVRMIQNMELIETQSKNIKERERMILTTTGSIFKKMMDNQDGLDDDELNKLESFNEDILKSLIQGQKRFVTEVNKSQMH